jgi:hypothetical protein
LEKWCPGPEVAFLSAALAQVLRTGGSRRLFISCAAGLAFSFAAWRAAGRPDESVKIIAQMWPKPFFCKNQHITFSVEKK